MQRCYTILSSGKKNAAMRFSVTRFRKNVSRKSHSARRSYVRSDWRKAAEMEWEGCSCFFSRALSLQWKHPNWKEWRTWTGFGADELLVDERVEWPFAHDRRWNCGVSDEPETRLLKSNAHNLIGYTSPLLFRPGCRLTSAQPLQVYKGESNWQAGATFATHPVSFAIRGLINSDKTTSHIYSVAQKSKPLSYIIIISCKNGN